MLKLFNSLTRKKETFVPIQEGQVGLYVCGVTTYDDCHLGHAKTYVAFDVIVRFLRSQGYRVCYVRNITDIDDKIINKAQSLGVDVATVTQRYIQSMHDDFELLGLLVPDQEPRATETIPQIIELIEELVAREHAYVAGNGDVCFSVASFKAYGALAHKDLQGLRAGARVAVDEGKRDPLDFVLWKLAKPNEPAWDSPWGAGRPGWHIECSAMTKQCLGEHFDLHGGGFDLQFPHHENEMAQSCAASAKPFVNYWLHVGYLQVDAEKMSKSLGNFLTIEEACQQIPGEVVRYCLLASHYRSQLNYTQDSLSHAFAALSRFYLALRELPIVPLDETVAQDYQKRFVEAMEDDFNTPIALAVLFDLVREINRVRATDRTYAAKLAARLRDLAALLGLLQTDPQVFLQPQSDVESQAIQAKIQEREQARLGRDFARADAIRAQLLEQGIVLEDNAKGTIWRRVSLS